jgi:hypothetical protein
MRAGVAKERIAPWTARSAISDNIASASRPISSASFRTWTTNRCKNCWAGRSHDEKLIRLLRQVIASGEGIVTAEATPTWFPDDDLWAVLRPTGLPIGNLADDGNVS